MKKNMMYEAPLVEVEELMVEQGFSLSLEGDSSDPQNEDWGTEDLW